MIAALVPVKRLDLAKSRLAPLGDRAFTRRLALAMLGDVLEPLLASRRIGAVAVVTEDEEVAAAARGEGARAIVQVDDGLNASLRTASPALARDSAQAVLVVLGDVAGVTTEDVDALLDALEAPAGAASCWRPRDGGTAALLRAPHDAIDVHRQRQCDCASKRCSAAGRIAARGGEGRARDRPRRSRRRGVVPAHDGRRRTHARPARATRAGRPVSRALHLVALEGFPLVRSVDDLAALVLEAARHSTVSLREGVLVLCPRSVS